MIAAILGGRGERECQLLKKSFEKMDGKKKKGEKGRRLLTHVGEAAGG